MVKLHIDHSDGRYYVRALTAYEVAERGALDLDVAYLEDAAWESYRRHCDRDATWQVLWRSISNEQYMRRREKELMPLEDAQREIARLKEELARARRMTRFYEEMEVQHRRAEHREEWVEYTCVFPLPGCDVGALPEAWQERAREIMESYREDLAAEGIRIQGCCCGHDHHKFDDAAVAKFRAAGFLVEHDAELQERRCEVMSAIADEDVPV